jgi:hypothetical protein
VVAQLVDVSNGLNVWSEIYDRRTGDVFAVQDEISSAIADTLRSQIGRSQAGQQLAKMDTRNADAYLSYLKGRYHLAALTRPEIEKGMLYLEQAIDKDPNYALAYAGLAEGYSLLADDNFSPPREVMPKAEEAARRALAIDDSLAEAHAVLGLVESTYEWDWQGSDREFRRAIALNPKYASAYEWYGLTCLASTGARRKRSLQLVKPRSWTHFQWKRTQTWRLCSSGWAGTMMRSESIRIPWILILTSSGHTATWGLPCLRNMHIEIPSECSKRQIPFHRTILRCWPPSAIAMPSRATPKALNISLFV